jgi:acyl-CoA synthetase (AMP-forming)/AMP-acid ligase II
MSSHAACRGHYDDDGYFWFSSRDDDVIITAGYRVGPFEVESALLEHPAVAESAVVACPGTGSAAGGWMLEACADGTRHNAAIPACYCLVLPPLLQIIADASNHQCGKHLC